MRRCLVLLALAACRPSTGDGPDPSDDDGVDSDTEVPLVEAHPHPAHRLSVEEIRRSLADVLGVDVDVAAVLPPDALLHGFDHADASTSLTSDFVERWADLVGDVVDRALAAEVRVPAATATATVDAELLPWSTGSVGVPWIIDTAWWVLQGAGEASVGFELPGGPVAWDVDLVAVLAPPDDGSLHLVVEVDGEAAVDVVRDTWPGPAAVSPRERLALGPLAPGAHTLSIRTTFEGAPPPSDWEPRYPGVPEAPFLAVDALEATGPTTPEHADPSPPRARLLTCTPDPDAPAPCLEATLRPVVRRLWRREPTSAEVDRLVGLAVATLEGGTLDEAVGAALQAALLSPSFLFRLDVGSHVVDEDGRPLRASVLATRLSFAVWGLPPDDALLDCAAADGLRDGDDPCDLPAQLDRLLADPRADALVDRFLRSWLGVDVFAHLRLSVSQEVRSTDTLYAALEDELRGLGREVLLGDRDLRDLVDADHAWLRFPLGALYDVDVPAWTPAAVPLADDRAGVLTGGMVLASSSLSGSPVQRGAWLTRTLLCTEPPKPPQGVPPPPAVPADGDPNAAFDQHLSDPVCRSCHGGFEPYGRVLALYGPLGDRRVDADGELLQVETTLPTGEVVSDAAELAAALRADPRLDACAVQRLLLWVLGDEVADADAVERIRARADADGFTARALLQAIVADPLFTEASP